MLAALVCPLSIGASTAPQDPCAWVSCRVCWQPRCGPSHSWPRKHLPLSGQRDAGLGKPDLCCLSIPPCRHSPKAQGTSPELFCSNEKQTSRGEGRAQRDPRCKLRGYGRTHIHSPAPPRYCSTAINHREALEFRAVFSRREPGVPEPRCCLAVPADSPGDRRAEPSTPTHPAGAPRLSPFRACPTPSAPFPQPCITQLEIMLLPVTSKPTGASAKVNTSSSQFH